MNVTGTQLMNKPNCSELQTDAFGEWMSFLIFKAQEAFAIEELYDQNSFRYNML
jgi:hypothetical protein